ncbi:EscU/YscU/HrcU family type III secretion system export apparatus switch protein, partial [Bacillus sp. D-CC]
MISVSDAVQLNPIILTIFSKVIKPKASRINPKNYFTRLFSRKSLVDILKSLFYMGLIGYVAYVLFKKNLEKIVSMIGFML